MELDTRMIVGLVVAAAAGYLLILFLRKLIEGVDKACGGALSRNKILLGVGIVLDGLLPWLPCIPSGFLAVLIMSYWPPDAIWDNDLLYFLSGALAGVVGSQIYYSITRAIKKQAARVTLGPAQSPGTPTPSDPPPPPTS